TPPTCWTAVFDLYFALLPNWNCTSASPAFGFTEAVTIALVGVIDLARPVLAVGGATSYAPMSQPAPLGRRTPRSSVAGQPAPGEGTASIAALPGASEIVCAGPPLSCSGPRFGSAVENVAGHPAPAKLRLCPESIIEPKQLPPLLDAS